MNRLPFEIERRPLVRGHDTTDPEHGVHPEKRSIQEHMKLGVINLDKPPGPTSHEVVAWLKRVINLKRAGHGGTLDPAVSGVLPVAIEDATKMVQTLLPAGKEYVCVMHLHGNVSDEVLERTMEEFTGEIYQKPPLRAAVRRRLRVRKIYYMELLERDGRDFLFRVGCEAGTYIRKLVSDMGEAMGPGAHMSGLRRTRTGPFREDDSVKLQDVVDSYEFWKENGDESLLRKTILPVEAAVGHLPKIVIRDGAVDAICRGASLAAPGVLSIDDPTRAGELVAIMTLKGELVCIAVTTIGSREMFEAEHGIVAKPERVVMKPGTYPRMWKK